jgi:3-hydroxyisobutyrate dehydrogenase-like beta-hydroxyacid dehydrogenase
MAGIATIGFGEAAQAFVSGWQADPDVKTLGAIASFDVKIEDLTQRSALLDASSRLDVECTETPEDALSGRNLVFSLVTADRALEAATRVASLLDPGTLYLDCNSCSPATKAAASELVNAAGAIYVDVAVMSPVHPAGHRTPLLVAGPAADLACRHLASLGMNAKVAGEKIGHASSIKMLRSVMIKGLEALTAECLLAARRAGVEQDVLASLQASDPGIDWTKRSAYNLERMMVHGRRRAAEMREVAATLRELGIPDRMAAATVEWQRQLGELEIRDSDNSLGNRADSILERILG